MADTTESVANLLAQLSKIVRSLTPAEAESLAAGIGKIAYVAPTARVLEKSRALELAIRAVQKLDEGALAELESGGAKLVVLRKGQKVIAPIDISAIAADVSRLDSEDQILEYLDADARFGPPVLKKVAQELGIVLPPAAKAKPAMQQHIARSLMSYRMSAPKGLQVPS